jgi:spore coat protein U-like protein
MRKVVAATTFAVACLSLAASSAGATTSTANMNVSITITAGCTIGVTNINFGSVASSVLATAQTSTTTMGGAFSYQCSPGSNTPALTASQGNNFASPNNRMKGSTSGGFLPYSLALPTIATFTGAPQSGQITATIPAQVTLPTVDSYSDTVVLTLTY